MTKSQQELEEEVQSLKEEIKDLKYEKRIEALENKLEQKQPPTGDSEFVEKLGNYKTYIVLSIFLDFFFIFTIMVFIRDSQLERIKKNQDVSSDLKNSLTNWRIFFVIIFILKIIGLLALISDSMAPTTY